VPAPDGLETFTSENWDREVLRSTLPVVVSFWAGWCVPCHIAAPALADAARASEGRLRFGAVSYDENVALADRYEVRGLPTVLVVREGEVCVRRVGLMGRRELRRMLDACAA
jgi:thioredoxin 1